MKTLIFTLILILTPILLGCNQTEYPLTTYWGGHIETPDSINIRLMYIWDSNYSPTIQVYQSMDFEPDYVISHDSISIDTIKLLRCYDAYIEYYYHELNTQKVDTFHFIPIQDSLYIFGKPTQIIN